MESAVQHGAAAFVAGLQATGAEGNPAQARGTWRCGKRSAFPTSPHPRRRLRTNFKRGATLTIYLVQKIGQVIPMWAYGHAAPREPYRKAHFLDCECWACGEESKKGL